MTFQLKIGSTPTTDHACFADVIDHATANMRTAEAWHDTAMVREVGTPNRWRLRYNDRTGQVEVS